MSSMFERFVEMAKEEFGYTVIQTTSKDITTFESLFGVSAESIDQYELPYNISVEQFVYHAEPAMPDSIDILHSINNFEACESTNMAA